MDTFSVAALRDFANRHLAPFGIDLITAVIVFFVGRWLARVLIRGASALMERSGVDLSLRKFLADLLYAVMLVVIVIAALDQVGVRTTAVIAVLGAAGLAVGLALQGSLSNFAAGVMIIVLRIYKVGDLVVIGKYLGRVETIKVFHTLLITGDHREITIPNAQIVANPIENLTVLGTRRIDIQITVDQGSDLHQIKRWLEGVTRGDARVLAAPAAALDLGEITPDAFKLYLRPWTRVDDYASVAGDTLERIREVLAAHQVKFSVLLDKGA
jgi:small conductance mechanosensitive channel